MNSDFASEMREVEIENTQAQSVSASGAAVPQTNVASVKAKAPNTGDNSGLDAWLMIMVQRAKRYGNHDIQKKATEII